MISVDIAGQLAIQAVGFGETVANTPILVNFEGKTAYEVVMNGGYTVYIDAVTGALLYNPFTGDTSATIKFRPGNPGSLPIRKQQFCLWLGRGALSADSGVCRGIQ